MSYNEYAQDDTTMTESSQQESSLGLFGQSADIGLNDIRATYAQRGAQYGDSWRECQWLTLRAVLKKMCETKGAIANRWLVALGLAALIDQKYQRRMGGFNIDHLIDGAAYEAALIGIIKGTECDENSRAKAEPSTGVVEDRDGGVGQQCCQSTDDFTHNAFRGIGDEFFDSHLAGSNANLSPMPTV